MAHSQARGTTSSRHVESADDYANLVDAHALQGTSDSLYPGLNYENLSQYLKPRQHEQPQQLTAPLIRSLDSAFAVLYDLSIEGPSRVTEFDRPDVFENSQVIRRLGDSESGYLLFLRGNPTPQWLNTIGYTCNVDPEYFLRHLDFRATAGKPDYFNLPGLPSSNANFLRLHWTTIGSRGTILIKNGQDQELIESLRRNSAQSMAHYLEQIRSGDTLKPCDSFVRRFAVHDETHFSFEQDVSLCTTWVGKSWITIIWEDVGNNLSEGPAGPWIPAELRSYSWNTRALPTLQYKPNMALQARIPPVRRASEPRPTRKFQQTSSLIHQNYGENLDPEIASHNTFYALTDLFKFTAFSEVQFLNMMETKLMKETDFYIMNSRQSPTLSNLLYNKNSLTQHVQHIESTILSIKNCHASGPSDTSKETLAKVDELASTLLEDFEYLCERAKSLSAYCDRGMNIVMNNNMILESQRAIEQAAGVAKLTKLAFFYIPLSFTTSFFGMNFVEFGTGTNRIWIWFAASAPVFLISVLLLAFDVWGWIEGLWAAFCRSLTRTTV